MSTPAFLRTQLPSQLPSPELAPSSPLTRVGNVASFVFKELPEKGINLLEKQIQTVVPAEYHQFVTYLVPLLATGACAFLLFKVFASLSSPRPLPPATPPPPAREREQEQPKIDASTTVNNGEPKEVAKPAVVVEQVAVTEQITPLPILPPPPGEPVNHALLPPESQDPHSDNSSSLQSPVIQREKIETKEQERRRLDREDEGLNSENESEVLDGEYDLITADELTGAVIPNQSASSSSIVSATLGGVTAFFAKGIDALIEHNDPKKLQKYTLALQAYRKALDQAELSTFAQITIKNLAKGSSSNQMYKHLDLALKTLYQRGADPRTEYQTYIKELRAVFTSEEYGKIRYAELSKLSPPERQCRNLVRSLVYVRWYEADLFDYLAEVTDHFINDYNKNHPKASKDIAPLTLANFGSTLLDLNKKVYGASYQVSKPLPALMLQKLLGEIGAKDFTGEENLPHPLAVHFYAAPGQPIKMVGYHRHGSPTQGVSVAQAGVSFLSSLAAPIFGNGTLGTGEQVVPDYKEAILAAKEKGESILYCNHQRRLKGDPEYTRVSVLEELQGKDLENHHVFTQSLESPLFKGEDSITFADLQKQLIASFYGEDAPCSLPLCLQKEQDYRTAVLPLLIKNVRDIFFPGKLELDTQEERQSFILLFYVFQKIDLKLRLNITHYKTPCKDFLDRGGMMAMLENIAHLCMREGNISPEELNGVLYNALGAAILVKKIGVIERRFLPGLAVVKRLSELSLEQRKQLSHPTFMGPWRVYNVLIGRSR